MFSVYSAQMYLFFFSAELNSSCFTAVFWCEFRKITGRAVIKLTLALTNTCSSCNSNEVKACWGEAFQLQHSQLAWLDGFQQLFRWKEANQDRLALWLFAERARGFLSSFWIKRHKTNWGQCLQWSHLQEKDWNLVFKVRCLLRILILYYPHPSFW